jgi:hypothetical protein
MDKELRSKQWEKDRLLNPEFEYTHSSKTDIAETFRRIRAKQEKEQEAKVYSIKRSK